MKKLILAMCTASLLFSCTDDDSLSTNSAPVADNNGIEVVEVSNGNVVQGTRTLGDGELALKFDSEASFQKFKNELLNESSFARTETISKYGIKNLYDLADDADAELEKIGNEATSLSDFNAKYSEYKKKYEELLITDASDNSDVSLYVPNADSPESYIANKDGYFVVGNEVRKISVNSENYPHYPSLLNPAKRNVLDLKNETCKNREKRNVLKISRTRHFKTTKKQSRTGCFYSF